MPPIDDETMDRYRAYLKLLACIQLDSFLGRQVDASDLVQQTLTLEYGSGVIDLAWHPDGKSLYAVEFGGGATVRIWDSTVDRKQSAYW